jgi:hypothetical protein
MLPTDHQQSTSQWSLDNVQLNPENPTQQIIILVKANFEEEVLQVKEQHATVRVHNNKAVCTTIK